MRRLRHTFKPWFGVAHRKGGLGELQQQERSPFDTLLATGTVPFFRGTDFCTVGHFSRCLKPVVDEE